MHRTLYRVIEDTRQAAAELRESAVRLDDDVDGKLARFEEALRNALSSSPDCRTIALPEEMVALDALCDLHVALARAPEALRERFRPIVDAWISYAAATGMTAHQMSERASGRSPLDTWLEAEDRPTR